MPFAQPHCRTGNLLFIALLLGCSPDNNEVQVQGEAVPAATVRERAPEIVSEPRAVTPEVGNRVASDNATANREGKPADEVGILFSERMAKYEKELAQWQSSVDRNAAIEKELAMARATLATLIDSQPVPQTFEQRQWSTFDEKYKANATLFTTDNVRTTLKKFDGKTIEIEKDKLIAADRLYISSAYAELAAYKESVKYWQSEQEKESVRIATLGNKLAVTNVRKPVPPNRNVIVVEIQDRVAAEKRRETPAPRPDREAKLENEREKGLCDKYGINDEDNGTLFELMLFDARGEKIRSLTKSYKLVNREYAESLKSNDFRFELTPQQRFEAFCELSAVNQVYAERHDSAGANKELQRIYRYSFITEKQAQSILNEFEFAVISIRYEKELDGSISRHESEPLAIFLAGSEDLSSHSRFQREWETESLQKAKKEAEAERRYFAALPDEANKHQEWLEQLRELKDKHLAEEVTMLARIRADNEEYYQLMAKYNKLGGPRFGVAEQMRREFYFKYCALREVYSSTSFRVTSYNNVTISKRMKEFQVEFGISDALAEEILVEYWQKNGEGMAAIRKRHIRDQ